MSTESLPAWVEVGAEALLVWGHQDEHVERMSVTRVTPSGQVVVTGNSRGERRFMARDFQKDGTAHRYEGGTFAVGSRDLYPLAHPRVPLLLAKQEYRQAWSRVRRAMDRLEKAETGREQGDSLQYAAALVDALTTWRRAKENLSAFS
jgi:hypothetical protein